MGEFYTFGQEFLGAKKPDVKADSGYECVDLDLSNVPEESVDGILLKAIVHHFSDDEQRCLASACARALRRGGLLRCGSGSRLCKTASSCCFSCC